MPALDVLRLSLNEGETSGEDLHLLFASMSEMT
jgi:hypothetical protein